MFSLLRLSTFLVLGVVAVVAALATGGVQSSHAGQVEDPLGVECKDIGAGAPQIACVSLDPESGSNTVGDIHTVTATMSSDDGQTPLEGVDLYIFVIKGPNAGERVHAVTDASGQVALTYTGDGGTGTDQMGTEACFNGCDFDVDGFIDGCVADPDPCVDTFFNHPTCNGSVDDDFVCDSATKDWVEATPTPTPAPTATLTATPTATPAEAAPAGELPATGSNPTGGSAFPLAGVIALAVGGVALLAAGVALVGRSR